MALGGVCGMIDWMYVIVISHGPVLGSLMECVVKRGMRLMVGGMASGNLAYFRAFGQFFSRQLDCVVCGSLWNKMVPYICRQEGAYQATCNHCNEKA